MSARHFSPHLQGLRHALAALLLLPFLALCLLSPAAMLERGSSGALVMVLCTGDGPVEMTVDLGTGHDTGTPQTKQRCDWATAHAAVLDVAPIALPSATAAYHRAAPALAIALWRAAHDPRNLWARGPPNLV